MVAYFRQYGVITCLFLAQLVFWQHTHRILPDMAIVPEVPGKEVVKALSLGDEQFYFRYLALNLQNAGDTYGRFTPLKDYNYKKLSKWLYLLDSLDNMSDYLPSLATYYYSQTQNTPDVRYMVDYLYDYAKDRPEKKWWWLIQAIYLANHKLEDKDLALKIAQPLLDAQGIPLWARHFSAFLYEQKGEMQDALYVIEHVLKGYEKQTLSREDFNFMKYFVEERLKKAVPEYFDKMAPKKPITHPNTTPAVIEKK